MGGRRRGGKVEIYKTSLFLFFSLCKKKEEEEELGVGA